MNNDGHKNSEMYSKRRHVPGISWRLFGSLIIFTVLILVVIWVFQIVLLNKFYEDSKLQEFTETERLVKNDIGNI